MSGKRRVYEVARDLGMDNKALVALVQTLGVPDVKNHMSALSPEDEEKIKRHLEKKNEPAEVARPAVVKRRAAVVVRRKKPDEEGGEAPSNVEASEAPIQVEPVVVQEPAVEEERPAPQQVQVEAREEAPAEPSAPVQEAPAREPEPEPAPPVMVPPAHEAAATEEVGETPVVPKAPAPPVIGRAPAPLPSAAPQAAAAQSTAPTPSQAPGVARPSQQPAKRGIEVWEGRPGVSMQNHRAGPRRVQYDAKAPGALGQRRPGAPPGMGGPQGPGGRMGGPPGRGGPGMRHRGSGSFSRGKGGMTVTKERSAHKKVVRIEESVLLQGLAGSMGVKATDLLRKLFQLGMTGININSTLDADTAKIVAGEFGWEVEDVAVSEADQIQAAQGIGTEDNEEDLKPRPPVVSVMGHVDHGKTSLLDALRKTNVVSGEAGGITQHIGAYSVKTPHGPITFLDTPGHEAFTAMRMRGAQATDITVLVVAADDGVMPQTKEAVNHARAAQVPIVVAINKCDKPEAQPERVRRELSEIGLVPEEWGGDTLIQEVSAHTKAGLDELLERLLLQAEMLNLRANPDKPAVGIVVEAQLDRGKGPLATVLVTEGTLHAGDVVLAGAAYGKVRAMHDSQGQPMKEATPSTPAALIGLSEVPRAGEQVYVMKDLKTAQEIAESRKTKERRSLAPSAGNKPRSLEEIAKLMAEQEQLELKVIIKSDVAGSAEAVSDALLRLTTDKVRVSVVHSAAGAITENDVNLAVAAGAIIIGFNARPAGKAASLAQQEGVEIRQYSIIYNVVDEVKLAMEGLLAPKLVEKDIGKAEVRQTFRISKAGIIAGCMVTEGIIKRGCQARLIRAGAQIWEGKLVGLKRFKDDAKEVKEGFECGISLDGLEDIKPGDIISAFEIEQIKQKL